VVEEHTPSHVRFKDGIQAGGTRRPQPLSTRPVLVRPGFPTIAVIGAGISGLSAAARLEELGARPLVLEKSRGLGGRSATRRVGHLAFDHGAQYFTVRAPLFEQALRPFLERGMVARWNPRIVELAPDRSRSPAKDSARFVGVPGMSALGRGLMGATEVRQGVRIVGMKRGAEERWTLFCEQGSEHGPFAGVIVTCPAPQAGKLLADRAPDLARQCGEVEMLPCWAIMVAFDPPLGLDLDAAFVDDDLLAWAACDSSKPGRRPRPECWTLHATSEWSRRRLEDDAGTVARSMIRRFFELTDSPAAEPATLLAHRWRFARSAEPGERGRLLDESRRLGVAGDWTQGDQLEAAFLSGRDIADRLASLI